MLFCVLELPHRRLVRRVGLRATEIDIVDDSFDWKSFSAWIVRLVGLLGLLALWIPFLYFLFICPTCYTAPGQIIDIGKHRHPAPKSSQLMYLHQGTDRVLYSDNDDVHLGLNQLRDTTMLRSDELNAVHDVDAYLPVPPIDEEEHSG